MPDGQLICLYMSVATPNLKRNFISFSLSHTHIHLFLLSLQANSTNDESPLSGYCILTAGAAIRIPARCLHLFVSQFSDRFLNKLKSIEQSIFLDFDWKENVFAPYTQATYLQIESIISCR